MKKSLKDAHKFYSFQDKNLIEEKVTLKFPIDVYNRIKNCTQSSNNLFRKLTNSFKLYTLIFFNRTASDLWD